MAAALAEQIARLNGAGKMSFKEAMGLRVGGMDQYSRWHLQELVTAVGASGVALIDAAFPGQAAEAIPQIETALRLSPRDPELSSFQFNICSAYTHLAQWEKTAARYRSEPETGEGTVELAERAKHAEHERDTKLAQYHNYELASAAFQIGIVLCSAAVITGMAILAWIAGGVAVVGIGLMGLGLFAPHLLHLG